MWCNLIRRKIRLHLSDQEIKSNQIKLTWTKQIILLFMPMFHDIISSTLFLFLFISFYIVLFLSSIFHCFLSPSDFFLLFSSPSASPSLCSQHYPLLSLHGFSYALPLASQNSWIDSKTVIFWKSLSSSTFANTLPLFTTLFKNYLSSNFKIHQCTNIPLENYQLLYLSLPLSGCVNIMSGQEIKIEEDLEKLINWNSKALWRYNGREEEDGRKKGESSMKWSEV